MLYACKIPMVDVLLSEALKLSLVYLEGGMGKRGGGGCAQADTCHFYTREAFMSRVNAHEQIHVTTHTRTHSQHNAMSDVQACRFRIRDFG
jgi:hypothetical protein